MNHQSRTQNSIRNMLFSWGGQLFGVGLSFVGRTIFINILGAEYLGVNGLFSNILSMLSVAELGIGSAITYSLYQPLARKDENQMKALMGFYATAYRIIACIVAVLGLALVPFLEDIIKDKPAIPHLTIIYLMFLASSVISYFFTYKNTLIIADQKQYVITIYSYGFNLAQSIAQIIVLMVTGNFLWYLAIQMACVFLSNFFIAKKVDRVYPFLNDGPKVYLDKESKKSLFKNIAAMMLHKIGAVIVFSTDNILISMFVGVYWVGLYSNYIMIIGIVKNFINTIFSSITASVGQLNAKESSEKAYRVFTTAFFLNFWIYSFCAVSFWVLFNPFITMWIGSQYVMDKDIVLIMIANFFVTGMRGTVLTYRDTMGLFWQDRFKPLFECAINFIASVILVIKLGIIGVLLGTFISTMTTCFWVEPYILYKYGFKKNVRTHFGKYILYTVITIVTALLTEVACSVFTTYTFLSMAGRVAFCLLIPNSIIAMLFFRTKEFKHVYEIVSGLSYRCLRIGNHQNM